MKSVFVWWQKKGLRHSHGLYLLIPFTTVQSAEPHATCKVPIALLHRWLKESRVQYNSICGSFSNARLNYAVIIKTDYLKEWLQDIMF